MAKTIPAMHDEIITPKILCRHTKIIVSGHFSVVCLEPYLQFKEIVLNKGSSRKDVGNVEGGVGQDMAKVVPSRLKFLSYK